jgi:hypothetical protein
MEEKGLVENNTADTAVTIITKQLDRAVHEHTSDLQLGFKLALLGQLNTLLVGDNTDDQGVTRFIQRMDHWTEGLSQEELNGVVATIALELSRDAYNETIRKCPSLPVLS